MEKTAFDTYLSQHGAEFQRIRELAHGVHDGVNQKYDKTHPYWLHLDMVVDNVVQYGWQVCDREDDILPMLFGAYFHDAIEDARLTYNDVLALSKGFFDDEHAVMAAEIAYALTNEKGRTRAERANDKYYAGIRATPYAPIAKLADRLANSTYSASLGRGVANVVMRDVYARENPHFLEAITSDSADKRLQLPPDMVQALVDVLK